MLTRLWCLPNPPIWKCLWILSLFALFLTRNYRLYKNWKLTICCEKHKKIRNTNIRVSLSCNLSMHAQLFFSSLWIAIWLDRLFCVLFFVFPHILFCITFFICYLNIFKHLILFSISFLLLSWLKPLFWFKSKSLWHR